MPDADTHDISRAIVPYWEPHSFGLLAPDILKTLKNREHGNDFAYGIRVFMKPYKICFKMKHTSTGTGIITQTRSYPHKNENQNAHIEKVF